VTYQELGSFRLTKQECYTFNQASLLLILKV